MTKQAFLAHCLDAYGTVPDFPFDDWMESAVLRHADTQKWYGIVMRVSRCKFGIESDEQVDVVNLKLPTEMFGSFSPAEGVYPAYHMNKLHWISVLLPDTEDDLILFLTDVSYQATRKTTKSKRAKA